MSTASPSDPPRRRPQTGREAFIERMIQSADGPTVTLHTCFGTPYEVDVEALRRSLHERISMSTGPSEAG